MSYALPKLWAIALNRFQRQQADRELIRQGQAEFCFVLGFCWLVQFPLFALPGPPFAPGDAHLRARQVAK
jgi:hypothetical protein